MSNKSTLSGALRWRRAGSLLTASPQTRLGSKLVREFSDQAREAG